MEANNTQKPRSSKGQMARKAERTAHTRARSPNCLRHRNTHTKNRPDSTGGSPRAHSRKPDLHLGASCLRGPRLRRAAVAPVWKLESRTWRGTAFVCWRVSRAGGRKGSGEPMSYCRNNSLVPERHVNAPPRYSLGLVREVRHIKNNDFPREPSCFALKTHGGVRKTIYSIVVEPGAND